ncbi:MAG: choice-of-anchor D domain-containing protein [Bryobacteraceae bacterium]|jgi:subtilase family serine protease
MKRSTLSHIVLCAGLFAAVGNAQTLPLVTQTIDEAHLVILRGNVHPLARPQYDRGPVPDSFELRHLCLLLKRAPEREQAVQRFIGQLHDPASTLYHHWLTPQETGEQFGLAQPDIDSIVGWLGSHGFRIDQVYPNRTAIEFSGAAAQVREAFHAEIHRYVVKEQEHWANSADLRIPAALAPVVAGVAKLNDFGAHPAYHAGGRAIRSRQTGKWQPVDPVADDTLSFSDLDYYLVAPYDFATIYNLLPLWNAGTAGLNQTIALVEDSNINPSDVAAFRAGLGLAALQPDQLQLICVPGVACATTADETEGAIDAEWAGAVAPSATVLYVAADTLEDSATYIVTNNLAPVVSISFSACESDLGSSGNALWANLWQTASLQGQTVVAAAGDFGGAVCDSDQNATAPYATLGLSVNGIASTPYNVAVGGTDFSDTFAGTNNAYWSSGNTSGSLQSALSYVPEMTWNNSCASNVLSGFLGFPRGEFTCEILPYFFGTNPLNVLNIVAGSGGPSSVYVKPTWQANVDGIVNDGVRDLPDVSLFASDNAWSHAYIYCMSDPAENGTPCDYTNAGDTVFNSGGGTSFAAPAFAGIMALVGQQTGSAQGNANYVLYSLAGDEYGTPAAPNTEALAACNAGVGNQISSTCLFYDVTLGDTTVPCLTGSLNCYTVTAGDAQGVLSTSAASLESAYQAGAGWDFATGLGSVNIANLVGGWGTSAADYTISGEVMLGDAALAGVAVSLTGGRTGSAVTNSSGKYTFVVPGSRAYVVTPALSGYTFNPPSQNFKTLSGNRTANFTGIGSVPLASLSTGSLAFGNQDAGVRSTAQLVVLTNTGDGPLTLTALAAGGPNAADFTWTLTCGTLPAQIAAGASCTAEVSFTPSIAGAETATLTFTDNSDAKAGSTQSVGLSGTGIVSLAITPTSVNFGYAGVNIASAPHTVQISNTSAIAVSLSKISVTGTNAGDFKPSNACGSSLAPGAKCAVSLVFKPAAAGSRSAALSIADSATGSPQTVALSGAGTEKAVTELSTTSLAFPPTSVGATSTAQKVTVTNGGHAELTIIGISASDYFAQTNTCTAPLASGATCPVSVTFKPTLAGTLTGTLTVTGNGVVFNTEVKLTGTGE